MPAHSQSQSRHHLPQLEDEEAHNPNSNPNSQTTPTGYPRFPNPRILNFILRSIIMLFAISFFFLFLGIAALAVLHLFLPGGRLHRHRHRRQYLTPSGLSPDDLKKLLPSFDYVVDVAEAEEDCAVCLEGFEGGESCRSLPGCCHVFHAACVDRWLVKVANCPICRTRVRLEKPCDGADGKGDDESKPLSSVEGSIEFVSRV